MVRQRAAHGVLFGNYVWLAISPGHLDPHIRLRSHSKCHRPSALIESYSAAHQIAPDSTSRLGFPSCPYDRAMRRSRSLYPHSLRCAFARWLSEYVFEALRSNEQIVVCHLYGLSRLRARSFAGNGMRTPHDRPSCADGKLL